MLWEIPRTHFSVAHAPRSPILHRSEQKGRKLDSGFHSTGVRQRGHDTTSGVGTMVYSVTGMSKSLLHLDLQ